MTPYAHSPNSSGCWHELESHLKCTATVAKAFASKWGDDPAELAWWLGWWHDLGKSNPAFQEYLQKSAIGDMERGKGVPHSVVGALLASLISHSQPDLAISLSLPIVGHHGGLSSKVALDQRIQDAKCDPNIKEIMKLALQRFPEARPSGALPLPSWWAGSGETLELFVRMLFSALVDADFLDTEQHFSPDRAAQRTMGSPGMAELWGCLQKAQSELSGKRHDPVNQARHEVYQACLRAAEEKPGLFRLTVPTGGGKTCSGMAFALRHAIAHGLDRVIVAIPYTSIIEQTAKVYRDIFGEDVVVEHHSNVIFENEETKQRRAHHGSSRPADDEMNLTPSMQRLRLACENWDVPVIVTTTVQLFESLLSNRPGRCRKLHNIARSVLILDEVQTLPVGLLNPILDVLQELVDHYGVTVVLSTATQPALEGESPYLKGFREEPKEIVPDPIHHFRALERVTYEVQREPWSWERVAQEMRQGNQCLCVVNARKDGLALLDALQDPDAMYLSTLLCGAHRRQVLAEVRARLKEGKPCCLVSTQVVEAGVDVDFPLVLRAVGPLDRIVQAAGRCNREGKMSGLGRMVVFEPAEGGTPRGAYRSGMDEARKLLALRDSDLNDPALYTRYFRALYQDVDTDAKRIQDRRNKLNFEAVAERFQMIDEKGIPVVVPYQGLENFPDGRIVDHGKIVKDLLCDAKHKGLTSGLLRKLQPYMVTLYQSDLTQQRNKGCIEEITPGLLVWTGAYDKVRGVQGVVRDPADLIA